MHSESCVGEQVAIPEVRINIEIVHFGVSRRNLKSLRFSQKEAVEMFSRMLRVIRD